MKVSNERFKELLSLYFDGEERPDEFFIFASCIKSSHIFARMYLDYLKIHIATCNMYARPVKLRETRLLVSLSVKSIRKSQRKKLGVKGHIKRWSALAASCAVCASLLGFALAGPEELPPQEPVKPSDFSSLILKDAKFSPKLNSFGNGDFCGLITFDEP